MELDPDEIRAWTEANERSRLAYEGDPGPHCVDDDPPARPYVIGMGNGPSRLYRAFQRALADLHAQRHLADRLRRENLVLSMRLSDLEVRLNEHGNVSDLRIRDSDDGDEGDGVLLGQVS